MKIKLRFQEDDMNEVVDNTYTEFEFEISMNKTKDQVDVTNLEVQEMSMSSALDQPCLIGIFNFQFST